MRSTWGSSPCHVLIRSSSTDSKRNSSSKYQMKLTGIVVFVHTEILLKPLNALCVMSERVLQQGMPHMKLVHSLIIAWFWAMQSNGFSYSKLPWKYFLLNTSLNNWLGNVFVINYVQLALGQHLVLSWFENARGTRGSFL